MEYQKIIIYLAIHQINHLSLEQKIELKELMNNGKHTTPITKLNLKLKYLNRKSSLFDYNNSPKHRNISSPSQ